MNFGKWCAQLCRIGVRVFGDRTFSYRQRTHNNVSPAFVPGVSTRHGKKEDRDTPQRDDETSANWIACETEASTVGGRAGTVAAAAVPAGI